MAFANPNLLIGIVLSALTTNFTGNMSWTMYLIFLVIFAIGMFFGLPLEIVATFCLPFVIATAAYYSGMYGVLVVIIIYISAILAKHFLLR